LGIIPIVSIGAVAAAKQARRAEKQAREEIIVIDYQESNAPPCETILEYNRLKVELNTIIYINKHVNSLQFHIVGEGGGEVLECLGTIKDLLPQLNDYPQLLQTHQSFIVNSRWVTHLTGNSNAMVISFANCPDKVQVSRKFVERVKKSLSNK
jgi:DNA-binding LytR/AlgR family response regulator